MHSEKWKKVEQPSNHGKTKTILRFLATGYTEFLSKTKKKFPSLYNWIGFLKVIPGEFNETNFENPCFIREFKVVSSKINEVFLPQKCFPLLSFSYSLLNSSCWEVIWKLSDLKPVTGNIEITRKGIQFSPSEFKYPPLVPFLQNSRTVWKFEVKDWAS